MVIARGKGEWGEVKEGKGGINGDWKRLDWAMGARCSMQMMLC